MDNISVEHKFPLPGGKLVEMMYKTFIDNGIATFWTNRVKIREAYANQEIERIKLLGAEQRKQDLKALKEGKLKVTENAIIQVDTVNGYDLKAIEQLAANSILKDTIRKEVNLAMAIEYAEETLLKDTPQLKATEADNSKYQSSTVDADWLFRWRDNACQVSHESMQLLWGKVLAGEIKQPGSVSLRTMETIKNFSKDDAELIFKLFSFTLNRSFIYRHEHYERKDDLFYNYGDIQYLEELGLLHGAQTSLVRHFDYKKDGEPFIAYTSYNHLIFTKLKEDNRMHKIQIPCYDLTQIGRELSFIGNFESNLDYLKYVAKQLSRFRIECQLFRFEHNELNQTIFYDADTGDLLHVHDDKSSSEDTPNI